MSDLSPHSGSWRTYPRNLSKQGLNTYGYDLDDYRDQLERDCERLFASSKSIHLKVVDLRQQDCYEQILTSGKDFIPYIEQPKPPGVTRIIFVPQETSWGRLSITEECLLKLLTSLQVFPAFINVLRAFGQKTTVKDESYGGFYFQESKISSVAECAYMMKYPEEHGRNEPSDPWSLRQFGVYHQFCSDTYSVFLVLNPSRPFMRRVRGAITSQEPLTPWKVQMMAISAAMDKWRWYISELERRFTLKKTSTQLSMVTKKEPGELYADITFEDTQDLQVLQDKLSQTLHFLTMNHKVIEELWARHDVFGEKECHDGHFIETLLVEASIEMNRVKSILKRAKGTQALAQSILDFTSLESMRSNSRTMMELTKLSQHEQEILLELTKKASRDTDILKTLTMLTLIYLPASLVSSIMGMGYIKVTTNEKRLTIEIAREMWIFLVLAFVLLVITMGSYYLWLRNKRTKRHTKLRKKYQISW